jgi:hypothetical protein
MQLKRKKRIIFSFGITLQVILISLHAYKLIYAIYDSRFLNEVTFVTGILVFLAWIAYFIYFANDSEKVERPSPKETK